MTIIMSDENKDIISSAPEGSGNKAKNTVKKETASPASGESASGDKTTGKDSPKVTRDAAERAAFPDAPRAEDADALKAKFEAGMQERREQLGNKSLEELRELVDQHNLIAKDVLEEKVEEAKAAAQAELWQAYSALGKPVPEGSKEQVHEALTILSDKSSSAEQKIAAGRQLNLSNKELLYMLHEVDPEGKNAVQETLSKKGELTPEDLAEPKSEEGEEPEDEDRKALRKEKETEGKNIQEGLKELSKLDMKDPANQEVARTKIAEGRTYLRDLFNSHFFEKKGFKIAKGTGIVLFFTALYIALMLVTLEMNLLIAIGKSGK